MIFWMYPCLVLGQGQGKGENLRVLDSRTLTPNGRYVELNIYIYINR